ncbi:MAG: hypothetical protein WBO34_07270 [Gammaproteobacteria bacterium]
MNLTRTSIRKLAAELSQHPYYAEHVEELIHATNTNESRHINFLPPKTQTSDDFTLLIHLWCAMNGLDSYETGNPEPTGWHGKEYASRANLLLEINRDELDEFLKENKLRALKKKTKHRRKTRNPIYELAEKRDKYYLAIPEPLPDYQTLLTELIDADQSEDK